jgi:hypothetical protein
MLRARMELAVGFDNEVMGDARLYRVSNNAFGLALKMERTTIFF